MDRNDIVRDTYAHYGLAMYQAQVLEHGIVNAMVYARLPDRHRITRGEIDAFMGRQFERTLGALLRELKKYVIACPALRPISPGRCGCATASLMSTSGNAP